MFFRDPGSTRQLMVGRLSNYHCLRWGFLHPFQVVGLGSSLAYQQLPLPEIQGIRPPRVRQPARVGRRMACLFFSRLMKNLVVFYQPIWKIWGPQVSRWKSTIFGKHHLSVSPIGFPFLDRGVKPLLTSSIYGEGEAVDVLPSSKTNRKIWWYGPVALSVAGGWHLCGRNGGLNISNRWIISYLNNKFLCCICSIYIENKSIYILHLNYMILPSTATVISDMWPRSLGGYRFQWTAWNI